MFWSDNQVMIFTEEIVSLDQSYFLTPQSHDNYHLSINIMEDNNELSKYQNDGDEYPVFHALPEAESRCYTFRYSSILIS
jgi:hypothetical protein